MSLIEIVYVGAFATGAGDGLAHRFEAIMDGVEEPIGFLSVYDSDREIEEIEVHADWRRRGVATQLLCYAEGWFGGEVKHALFFTTDGAAWASHVTGRVISANV